MEFQTESYEQHRDMLVLKHISHDVLYTLSNAGFIVMLLICCRVDIAHNPPFFLSLIAVNPFKKKKKKHLSIFFCPVFFFIFCRNSSTPTPGIKKSKKVLNTAFRLFFLPC